MAGVSGFFDDLRRHLERPALCDGVRRWSYRELLAEVSAWRQRLDAIGAQRVACRLPNGLDWVALDLALLSSGRVAIPIPDFFSAAQERHVLESSGADTCVTERGSAPPSLGRDPKQNGLVGHAWQVHSSRRLEVLPVPTDTHKITFTSGTTGTPKGVCLSAKHLLGTANAIRGALGDAGIERHLSVLPLSLLLENVAGLYANLGNGNEVCVPPLVDIGLRGSSGLDVAPFIEGQNRFRPHSLIVVPQLLLALTAAAEFGVTLPGDYRFVAVGGGRVPTALLERAARAGIPVYEGYGLTECGSVVTLNLPGASRSGTVGRPLDGARISVVEGEIHVSGPVMLGYLGETGAPQALATGDLGDIDEQGFLSIGGRRNNTFSTAFGRNVHPEWIESELCSEIAIGHAVVFGEALPANVAILVARGAADEDTVAEAVAAANARLPDYAQVHAWRCVDASDFQDSGCLTDNGRTRRHRVAQHYRELLLPLVDRVTKEPTHVAVRQA